MTYWEEISRDTVDGFDIVFSVAAEDMHPRDSFDMDAEELAQLCEDIDRGRYSWFVARVQAFRAGVELARRLRESRGLLRRHGGHRNP